MSQAGNKRWDIQEEKEFWDRVRWEICLVRQMVENAISI